MSNECDKELWVLQEVCFPMVGGQINLLVGAFTTKELACQRVNLIFSKMKLELDEYDSIIDRYYDRKAELISRKFSLRNRELELGIKLSPNVDRRIDMELSDIWFATHLRPDSFCYKCVKTDETRWYTRWGFYFSLRNCSLFRERDKSHLFMARETPLTDIVLDEWSEQPCPKEVDMADSWIPPQPRKGSRWNRCR